MRNQRELWLLKVPKYGGTCFTFTGSSILRSSSHFSLSLLPPSGKAITERRRCHTSSPPPLPPSPSPGSWINSICSFSCVKGGRERGEGENLVLPHTSLSYIVRNVLRICWCFLHTTYTSLPHPVGRMNEHLFVQY